MVPSSSIGRVTLVVFCLLGMLYLAVVTGTVVGFLTEMLRAQRDESVAHFITKLEHLPELSHNELVDLSDKIKRFRRKAN